MKAVLVVDVEEHGDYYVDVYRKDADDRFEGRYYLKPMPQHREMFVGDRDRREVMLGKAYYKGWNDCLEEITE